MGSTITMNPFYLLLGMLIVFLLGIGFAAISNGFAITLQREEPLVMIGNLMTLPLMFFSSALVPKQFMPDWIQYISVINPITYAVEGVRAVLVAPVDFGAYAMGLGIMAVFAGATLTWAVLAFNALRD
jgi:ABC-2 type transport system permease protein